MEQMLRYKRGRTQISAHPLAVPAFAVTLKSCMTLSIATTTIIPRNGTNRMHGSCAPHGGWGQLGKRNCEGYRESMGPIFGGMYNNLYYYLTAQNKECLTSF